MKSKVIAVWNWMIDVSCIVILVVLIVGVVFVVVSSGW